MEIIKSASKLVFLTLTVTACVSFFMGILDVSNFMILATAAYSYYFSKKDGK